MNRFFTILLLLVSFCGVTYGQDFIVLTTGDTLYGDLKTIDVDYYNGIILETESGTSEFTPNETDLFGIRSFTVDGRIYEAGISRNKFAEKFVEGTVQFFQDDKDFFLLKDERIFLLPFGNKQVHDQDGVIKEVQVDAWKTILKNLLADCNCPHYNKIDRFQWPTREFLKQLGQEYNEGKGEESKVFKDKEKTSKLSFSVGYELGILGVDGNELFQIDGDDSRRETDRQFDFSGVSLGIRHSLYIPLFRRETLLDFGLEYKSSELVLSRTITYVTGSVNRNLRIDRESFIIPVGLTIPLKKNNKGLHFFLHGLGEIRLSDRTYGDQTRTFDNSEPIRSSQEYNLETENAQMGFRGGVMYLIPIGKAKMASSIYYIQLSDIITSVSRTPVRATGFLVHYYLR